ncbi:hypothetical protein FJT64_000757 [Amphibalanus amphitrite]|uniref:Mab-21-like HhH/H2TH-like domain-containing protein n=1 Tax=Amphibalanus amphitrite TaxID=1232801 RepID=A0A6A4VCY5_AMPAM|nr:hypothetical protein FJT64_000757 [Amphibalanus amphitrite]
MALNLLVKKAGPISEKVVSLLLESNQPFNYRTHAVTRAWDNARRALHWLPGEPLWRCLQRCHVHAAGDCPSCSPLGRLSVLHFNQSGSSIEGLDDLDGNDGRQCASDVDVMMELGPCRWLRADDPEGPPLSVDPAPPDGDPDSAPLLVAEPTENPGFVLLFVKPTSACDHSNPRQFSADHLRRLVQDWCRTRHGSDVIIETAGPAVNVRQKGDIDGGIDWVPCLRWPVWPSEEFRTRRRVTDFPPAEAREDICRFGVHLVPTGHPGSSTEYTELRLSFSRAEVVAGWHLFPTVRIAARGLKNVKNEMKKRRKTTTVKDTGKRLKSYHIKTTALWLCQDLPRESWRSATTAMHLILDKLEKALTDGTLHCFFWTKINLFAEYTADDLCATQREVKRMRKRMLAALLAWHDTCFDLQPWYAHYQQKMAPDRASGSEETTSNDQQISDRSLQLFAARYITMYAVLEIIKHRHQGVSGVENCSDLPDLIRTELLRSRLGRRYHQGRIFVQAMLAAPDDLVGSARLVAHGGDVYTWDVAPLLALLEDSDMQLLLGEPDAVASWWRQQLRLPRAEQPEGMTADLDTPQGRKELLLNADLLLRACEESKALLTRRYCPPGSPELRCGCRETDQHALEEQRPGPAVPPPTAQKLRGLGSG